MTDLSDKCGDDFFETADVSGGTVYVLVIYDIADNKNRAKFVKLLQGYGSRVQKSAFEAIISKRKYRELLKRIPKYVQNNDSIKVYKIIGKGQVTSFGGAPRGKQEQENLIII